MSMPSQILCPPFPATKLSSNLSVISTSTTHPVLTSPSDLPPRLLRPTPNPVLPEGVDVASAFNVPVNDKSALEAPIRQNSAPQPAVVTLTNISIFNVLSGHTGFTHQSLASPPPHAGKCHCRREAR